MAQISIPQEHKLTLLKTYVNHFRFVDQLSVSNSLFISQTKFSSPVVYHDFEGFGKLGVISKKLARDYIQLKVFWDNIGSDIDGATVEHIQKMAKALAKLSQEDLRILSCLFFYGLQVLNANERREVRKSLMAIKQLTRFT